jgi:tetratricopeptide (TPR) repeat protein
MRRIDLHEGRRRLEEALAGAGGGTALRSRALLAAAAIEFRSGALSRSHAFADEARAVASETGDRRAEWRALQFLGELGLASDDADAALPWLERALALARREDLKAAEAIGVYSLAVARWILGDLAGAQRDVARSIELFGALVGSGRRILSPVNIADIRTSPRGDRPALRMVFEDTLQPFLEISCEAAIGYLLAYQAGMATAHGDLSGARRLLDASAARFEASREKRGRAAVLVRRAYLELAEGDCAKARRALEEALELRRRQGDRRGIGLVLTGLALVDTAAGNHARAERHLVRARELFRRAGDRWGLASALWRTADLAFARDRLDDAQAALQEARDVLAPTGRERWIANTLAGLAEVAILRGDLEGACALLVDARDRYAARDDALGVAEVEERLRALC